MAQKHVGWTPWLYKAVQHQIKLEKTENRPIQSILYDAGPKARELEKQEINQILAMDAIEYVKTEWASPIVFVPKEDGDLRLCVDFCKLNAVTIRDSYLIPRLEECTDSLGDARILSILDASSGYWRVEIAKEDCDKTAFTFHHGLSVLIACPLD